MRCQLLAADRQIYEGFHFEANFPLVEYPHLFLDKEHQIGLSITIEIASRHGCTKGGGQPNMVSRVQTCFRSIVYEGILEIVSSVLDKSQNEIVVSVPVQVHDGPRPGAVGRQFLRFDLPERITVNHSWGFLEVILAVVEYQIDPSISRQIESLNSL